MMIQPPTDNLYKFMAIVGLLLFIGGALYPWTKAYEIEKELIVVSAQLDHARIGATPSSVLEFDIKNKRIRLMFKATIAYFASGIVSMLIGGVLVYYGFRFWYLRVQKPLDKQLGEKQEAA
jgi:hypothetical protein